MRSCVSKFPPLPVPRVACPRDPLPTHRPPGKAAVSEDVSDDHPVGARPGHSLFDGTQGARSHRGHTGGGGVGL